MQASPIFYQSSLITKGNTMEDLNQTNTSTEDTSEDTQLPNDMASLKARADLMGIQYKGNISSAALAALIGKALQPAEQKEDNPVKKEVIESESGRRQRKRQEASRLVRIVVTCNNPARKEYDGELITVGNATGTYSKFVPFNNEEGWHVPFIIVEQLRERECQIFVSAKDSRGNKTRVSKMIKEFTVTVLDQLTTEELEELAQRQAMAHTFN